MPETETTPKLTIRYQEHDADAVVRYFVSGFEKPVEHHNWFYDAAKQKFVLKLYMRG